MAKRYLGGGISFEQKDVYQEFSEDEGGGGGGSTTLAGLTDVDISNPSNGQTLIYNAISGKWENGAGGSGGALIINVTEVTDYNSQPEEGDPYMIGNVSATLNEIQEAFTTNPKPVFMRIPKFQWGSATHFSYADSDSIIMLPVSYGFASVHYEAPNPLDGLKTFVLDRGLGSDVLEFYATFTIIH